MSLQLYKHTTPFKVNSTIKDGYKIILSYIKRLLHASTRKKFVSWTVNKGLAISPSSLNLCVGGGRGEGKKRRQKGSNCPRRQVTRSKLH